MPDLTKHYETPRWRLVSFSRSANTGHLLQVYNPGGPLAVLRGCSC